MPVRISPSSRLRFADLRIIDEITFWDIVDLPTFVPSDKDIRHTVQGFDRIDLIADKYYQDPALWWVVAWANDIEIVPTELNENDILIIPDPAFVQSGLFSTVSD